MRVIVKKRVMIAGVLLLISGPTRAQDISTEVYQSEDELFDALQRARQEKKDIVAVASHDAPAGCALTEVAS